MRDTRQFTQSFLLFLCFNACFLGLQLVFVYSHCHQWVSSFALPFRVYFEIVGSLVLHIALYVFLSLMQAWLLLAILRRSWKYFSSDQWHIIIWSLCVCVILCANVYFFPLSLFSKIVHPPTFNALTVFLFSTALLGLGLLVLNALLQLRKSFAVLLFMAFCLSFVMLPKKYVMGSSSAETPNVFLLGIDSLSPESITPHTMPFLHHILQSSSQFTNTISPLARTNPAWTSILTGLYAKNHHADENLVAKSTVDTQSSILWPLNEKHYTSIYATDDRRFNSIDTHFGFKEIIGPKTGSNDFLLGAYNDFPLTNLLINAPMSYWLFPYNYANRASYFSYYPSTFNTLLQKKMAKLSKRSPLFFAVHFALPHWPYAWATAFPDEVNNEFSLYNRTLLYQRALHEADAQLKLFFNYLKKQHYLENSMVILLSDHGEALYYPGSRLTSMERYQGTANSTLADYLKQHTATVINKSAGHGSDILSPMQYHSLLAFRIYKQGRLITKPHSSSTRVALIDIAPTILEFLHLPQRHLMDGMSLLKYILHPELPLPQRPFFLESGMFPNQDFSSKKAMKIGKEMYRVHPQTTAVEITPSALITVNKQKLYGVIQGNWILALYPNGASYIPVIQDLSTGHWVDDVSSDFAKHSPLSSLMQNLKDFYGEAHAFPIS